jgi:hypothetical protein
MKKATGIIIMTAVFVIAAAGVRAGQSGTFTIGPVIEYTWWAPYFENYVRGHDQDVGNSALSTFSMRDSSLFFGPEASYAFSERWSLSGRFLFAVQRGYRATGQYLWAAPGYGGYSNSHARYADRYDIDVLAGCSLNRIITIQFGAQSQIYNYSGDVNMFISSGATLYPLRPSSRMLSWSLGLSVGGIVYIPLAEGLSLDVSLHGLCLPGENLTNGLVKKKDPFISYGGQAGLALTYFFKKINASISIGGTYRVLRYSLLPGADANEKNFSTSHDQSYGVTASAIFIF